MKTMLFAFSLLILFSSCGDVNTSDTGNVGNSGETCIGSDKFCHSHDDLNWSDASSTSHAMNWDQAVTYCENLDGRLPTISELRTLIQNCPATETGGECKINDSCLSYDDCWSAPCDGCEVDSPIKYSVFGDDAYYFWSSSEPSDFADYAWGVSFYNGNVAGNSKVRNFTVRCVR